MNEWKEALSLSRYELKHSLITYGLLFICLVMILILLVPTIGDYLERNTFGNDIFFLLIFILIVQWCRPKFFKSQIDDRGLSVSHYVVMLNQLPIPKNILIKHRVLSYLLISIPFHVSFLVLFYILSPVMRDMLSIGGYIAFAIFWICLSIYFGLSEIAAEAGFYKVPVIFRNTIIAIVITFIIFIVFYQFSSIGFVHWIMILSAKHPIIVSLLSLVLARLGMNYWMRNMHRKIKSLDYY